VTIPAKRRREQTTSIANDFPISVRVLQNWEKAYPDLKRKRCNIAPMTANGNPMASLVYRHNRITRLTHWANFVALTILFMSGLQIFNAHPHLYWGHTSEPDAAILSISSSGAGGKERGYVEILGLQIPTTGFLGVQHTATEPVRQAFPGWLTIPGYFWLAGGRHWHFFFAWVFVLNGTLYVIYNLLNGHMRKFFLTPRDAAKIPAMIQYYLHLRKESPQEGEYNPLQKMAYTSVFLLLVPFVMLSGMAMSPQLDQAFNWLPAMFGGRQSARTIHFLLTFAFAAFVFGHVFMVLTTGVVNNMRSMISGWYKEKFPVAEPPPAAEIVEPIVEAPAVASPEPPKRESAAAAEDQKPESGPAPADASDLFTGAQKAGGKKNDSE
jgi:Ni/Fe-hydrogenase b-type cytochrome subunit